MVAVPVCATSELMVFHREPTRPGHVGQSCVAPIGIIAMEAAANGWQLLTVGLADVEDGHWPEAPHRSTVDLVIATTLDGRRDLGCHWGHDPEGLLPSPYCAVEFPPSVEARDSGRVWSLEDDKEDIPEGIGMESGLTVEVALPGVSRRKSRHPICQALQDFTSFVHGRRAHDSLGTGLSISAAMERTVGRLRRSC